MRFSVGKSAGMQVESAPCQSHKRIFISLAKAPPEIFTGLLAPVEIQTVSMNEGLANL